MCVSATLLQFTYVLFSIWRYIFLIWWNDPFIEVLLFYQLSFKYLCWIVNFNHFVFVFTSLHNSYVYLTTITRSALHWQFFIDSTEFLIALHGRMTTLCKYWQKVYIYISDTDWRLCVSVSAKHGLSETCLYLSDSMVLTVVVPQHTLPQYYRDCSDGDAWCFDNFVGGT